MAGHSHWAGIKHKKGKADKLRSKIFSKLSKEITVAAKSGDKDPSMNPRLRSAIQAARSAYWLIWLLGSSWPPCTGRQTSVPHTSPQMMAGGGGPPLRVKVGPKHC